MFSVEHRTAPPPHGRTSCRSARCSCSSLLAGGIWLGGHPDYLPGAGPRHAGRRRRRAALRRGRRHHRGRLLPQGRPQAAAQQGARLGGRARSTTASRTTSTRRPTSSFDEATAGRVRGRRHERRGGPARAARAHRLQGLAGRQGRAQARRRDHRRQRAARCSGASSEQATTRIKGRAGTEVTLTVVTGKDKPRDVELKRAKVDVPVVESRMIAHGRRARSPTSSSRASPRAPTARSARPSADLLGKGAKAVVLDLRDNGGGLLNEAVLVSSIFIPEGKIVTTQRALAARSTCSRRPAPRSTTKIPVAVLVNGESASASEIVTGALQDRDRATVVGTRTFGKGVFQEIKQLSNGGALDITVGEYFTPKGRNLGGGGPKKGAGHHARRQGAGQRQDEARRGARRRRARPRVRGAQPRERTSPRPVVAVLEKRGRFFTATPFFARGRRINLDKPAREVRAGDLVLVRADGPRRRPRQGAAAARAARHRARRARGADARPRAAAALRPGGRARGARRRRAAAARRRRAAARPRATCRPSRSTRRRRATSTTRSPPSGSTTARSASGSTSPTSPRTCRPARSSTARPTAAARASTSPARSSRCCRRRSPTRPARSCPARTASRSPSSSSSRARRCAARAFTRSLIRSDARLDYPRSTASSPARSGAEAPWAEPLDAARAAAAALEAARAGARRARGRVGRAGVRLLPRGPRDRARGAASRRSRTG